MSRINELELIDALEIVPNLKRDTPTGYNPFEGVKITAYRAPEVQKLVSEIEAERDAYKNKLEKIGLILEVRKILHQSN